MAEDIRPDYYKSCGHMGRRILRDSIPECQLNRECRDVIRSLGNDFDLGNALKYLWRAGKKNTDAREDLLKARFYLKAFSESCLYKQQFDPDAITDLVQKITEIVDA